MDSSLVIKVKYGDVLRRFNAYVDENNQLDLDMVRLRAKILSLFNFPVDSNFILRYVDEDGDWVNLVDDDDLHDVMRQHLKFLRIDVHVSYDSGGKSIARSSGSSTPLRSPPVPNQLLSRKVVIAADALKSVPEPLRETLAHFLLDFVSKAATSSPVFATLADCISKMGQSILNSDGQPQFAASPISKNGVPEETITPKGKGPQPTCVESNSNVSQQVEAENVTRGVVAGVNPFDLNILSCDPNPSQSTNVNAAPQSTCVESNSNASQQVEAEVVTRGVVAGVNPVGLNIFPSDPNPSQSTNVNTAPLSSAVPDADGKKGKVITNDSFTGKVYCSGTSTSSAAPEYISTLTTAMGSSPFVECPLSGTYIIDSVAPSFEKQHMHPFKRSHSHTGTMDGMFHKGICCDGCGVCPITGPCFKSKVSKVDYDLCSVCLNKMGNETDYIRIDHPMSFCASQSFKGVYEHPWMGSPKLPHLFRSGVNLKHARPKLDSQFVLDVNLMNGAMMAPSTVFTKIWRMQNNGTLVWPRGTQLVWIGGNKFSDSQSVDLKVPKDGVPVGQKLDIAVDFRAPQLPGRYISYWRMAHPYGKKFGQRVWVLIQVDASPKDMFYDRSKGPNLNIPLDATCSEGPQIVDFNVQPCVDSVFLQPHNSTAPAEPMKRMVDEQPRQELENDFPINESTFIGHNASLPSTSVAASSVSYPGIDLSKNAPAALLSQQSPAVDALSSDSSPLGMGGNNSEEEALLKELEEMGFKEVDLNREILRMNGYDLEQSVDDLLDDIF